MASKKVIVCGLCHTVADQEMKKRGNRTVLVLSCSKCKTKVAADLRCLGSFIWVDESMAKPKVVKPVKA
jgi:ribosomal protein L44E